MDGSVGTRDSGLVYVLMTPMLMSAWVVMQGSHQLAALFNHVDWRTRELLDCATLALRACWARSTFELERMSLLQLVLGIPPDSSEEHFRQAAAGPSSVTVQRLRQRAILLPSQPAASSVMLVRRQLNLHAFTQVLEAWLLDPEKPFAFYGPGNFKVDSWLFFHEPDKQLPLVLFVSSKQWLGRQTVNAAKIMEEMKKDVFGYAQDERALFFDFVYVYVTDQVVQSVPTDEHVVVIPPHLHRAFYGSMQQLLDLVKM